MMAPERSLIRPEGNVKHLTAWVQWIWCFFYFGKAHDGLRALIKAGKRLVRTRSSVLNSYQLPP